MDKYIGRLLDNRYEILEVIGTGGMAVVYKARCHRLNRLVAIKILKDDYLEDEDFRSRFHSESQAVAMLGHPNIVSVYDVSTSVSLEADYIVMELIEGISLKQYMEKKKFLNWKETLHFAIQIAKALQHAHSRGIVHRDIKPHNIMVLKNGSVKVTDFGIARLMSQGNTLTKEALGSVHYISPEQAKGGRVDDRSDLYSLGVVMYEMMCGRPPYDGDSPVAVAIQHINGGAVMPSTINPNIPGGLEQIIMKSMANEPGKRYSSATEMLQDMDEFRKDPAILFAYNVPPIDAVTNMHREPQVIPMPATPTTAERVANRGQTPRTTGNIVRNGDSRRTGTAAAGAAAAGAAAGRSTAGRGSTSGRSTASRNTASRTGSSSRSSANTKQKSSRKDEEGTNWVAIIAIILLSVVLLICIIWMLTQCQGKTPEEPVFVDAPDVVGKYWDDLDEDHPDINFQIIEEIFDEEKPAGLILEQDPAAGTPIDVAKDVVGVVISKGPAPLTAPMPDLENYEQTTAQNLLISKGMDLDVTVEMETSEEVKEGFVIRTEPAAGEILQKGSKVVLYVSAGLEIKEASMPDLINATRENAEKTLENQNMHLVVKVEEVFDSAVAEGRVVSTDPGVGSLIKTGDEITLYVSKGPELKAMPNLINMDISNASTVLKNSGFTKTPVIIYDFSETIEKDRVMLQSHEANQEIDVNTQITLTISKGPEATEETTVPSESTEPEQTTTTVSVTFSLPTGREETYSVKVLCDGVEVYSNGTMATDQTSLTVSVTGSGSATCVLQIDGETYETKTVNFA